MKAAKAKSCRYLVNPAWATAAWRNCQSANSLASSLCENPLMPGKNKPLRKAEMARIQKCDNCRDEISGVQSRSFCSCKQNKKYTSMKIYRASSESPKIFEWRGFAHRSARWPMRRPVWRPGKKKNRRDGRPRGWLFQPPLAVRLADALDSVQIAGRRAGRRAAELSLSRDCCRTKSPEYRPLPDGRAGPTRPER